MSAYPSAEEYALALGGPAGKRTFKSNPSRAILDELRHAKIDRGPKYLHIANGYFAYVYKFRTSSGKSYALRCLRFAPPSDIAERYRHIASLLRASKAPPYIVECDYIEDALFVPVGQQARYFPVFVMEWVDGKTLLERAGDLCRKRDKPQLASLAEAWRHLARQLLESGLVHGDLHPDNVKVTKDGALKLLDYDTLVVPGFPAGTDPVGGNAGYIHPCFLRGNAAMARVFHPHMDVFGALIILLSLRALAENPERWGKYSTENLLLPCNDLECPHQSSAFDDLERSSDPEIAELARQLRQECAQGQETLAFGFARFFGAGASPVPGLPPVFPIAAAPFAKADGVTILPHGERLEPVSTPARGGVRTLSHGERLEPVSPPADAPKLRTLPHSGLVSPADRKKP